MNDAFIRIGAIAVGGAVGSVARYVVGVGCVALWGERFPLGTLLVNVAGCFALGLFMHEAWAPATRSASVWHGALTVGVLGGLTTFSTFGYQTIRHFELGEPLLALLNMGLNLVLGLGAVVGGLMLSRALWPVA
jgi:fluoride exporter